MAIPDDRLWNLHLQNAMGNVLTPGEQADLEAWYAAQDRDELAALDIASEAAPGSLLKAQVEVILGRIITTSQSLKLLTEENEALRRENRHLRRQLAQRAMLKVA